MLYIMFTPQRTGYKAAVRLEVNSEITVVFEVLTGLRNVQSPAQIPSIVLYLLDFP